MGFSAEHEEEHFQKECEAVKQWWKVRGSEDIVG